MTAHDISAHFQQAIPHLRAYARSLTRNPDAADDLVQDTLIRGWAAREQFVEGTNFRAWMFTILRHRFFDERRRARQAHFPLSEVAQENLASRATQDVVIQFDDMARAFWKLTPHHREVLMLVGAVGLGYDEAAEVIGCAVGTIRSRLSRARAELQSVMDRKGDGTNPVRLPTERGAMEFLRQLSAA